MSSHRRRVQTAKLTVEPSDGRSAATGANIDDVASTRAPKRVNRSEKEQSTATKASEPPSAPRKGRGQPNLESRTKSAKWEGSNPRLMVSRNWYVARYGEGCGPKVLRDSHDKSDWVEIDELAAWVPIQPLALHKGHRLLDVLSLAESMAHKRPELQDLLWCVNALAFDFLVRDESEPKDEAKVAIESILQTVHRTAPRYVSHRPFGEDERVAPA